MSLFKTPARPRASALLHKLVAKDFEAKTRIWSSDMVREAVQLHAFRPKATGSLYNDVHKLAFLLLLDTHFFLFVRARPYLLYDGHGMSIADAISSCTWSGEAHAWIAYCTHIRYSTAHSHTPQYFLDAEVTHGQSFCDR